MPTGCPVCGRVGLPSTAVECPQCNADLEAFLLLETLQEVPPVPPGRTEAATDDALVADEALAAVGAEAFTVVHPPSPSSIRRAVPAVLAGLLLGMGVVYLIPRPDAVVPIASQAAIKLELRQVQQQLEEVRASMERRDEATGQRLDERLASIAERLPVLARRDDLAVLDERLSLLEQDLRQWKERAPIRPPAAVGGRSSAVRTTPKAKTPPVSEGGAMRAHRLTGSDTLWNISERYYGRGDLYPVLLALNPGLGLHFSPGGEIRLPADRAAAHRLLAGLVVKQDGRRLLRYPAVAGDTWERISQRLHGHAKIAAELRRLNGGRPPEPGKSVLVPLTN